MAIVVRNLESTATGGSFDVSASVSCDGRERRMTLRRYGDHPKIHDRVETFDPFAVALLVPAMMRGESLEIEGCVDGMLLDSLAGPSQDVLRLLEPRWHTVPVVAEPRAVTAVPDLSKGAATAMSGGVDSMHLVRRRLLAPDNPDCLKVRVLVHHHVGAHGDDDRVFAEQHAHARRIAERLGLPLVGVACSMTDLYRGMPFIGNALVRNVAASMALDHLFTFFLYASSGPVGKRPVLSRFTGISTLEPQLLPMFNTTRVSWLPFGGAATRLQKTAEVIWDDRLCGDLLVCIRGFRTDRAAVNCGRCYKCARLLLQAEASGRLDAVARSFDMPAYHDGRSHSVFRVLRFTLGPRRNETDIDLLKFLDSRGFAFPGWARPWVTLARLMHGRRHSLTDDRVRTARPAVGTR